MTSLTRWSIYVTSEVALAVFGFVAKWIFMDGADFTEVILVLNFVGNYQYVCGFI